MKKINHKELNKITIANYKSRIPNQTLLKYIIVPNLLLSEEDLKPFDLYSLIDTLLNERKSKK